MGKYGSPQQRARNFGGVGEKTHFGPNRRKVAFKALALRSTPPVVTLKEDVETQLSPDREDIVRHLRVSGIDELDGAENFEAVHDRDDGHGTFDPESNLVGNDARDQDIAMLPRVAQQIKVPDMKEVERARGIADAGHLVSLLIRETSPL